MTDIGTITKVLVTIQDLALGAGTVEQTRSGQTYTLNKLALPFAFSTIAEIKLLDYTKFPFVRLLGPNITEYYYDANASQTADDDFVLLPSSGIGRWLKTSVNISANIKTWSDPTYVINAYDAQLYLRFTAECEITVLEVTNMRAGTEVYIRNGSTTDDLTLVADGVTINWSTGGGLTIPPRGNATLKKITATVYDLFGDTSA